MAQQGIVRHRFLLCTSIVHAARRLVIKRDSSSDLLWEYFRQVYMRQSSMPVYIPG